MSNGDIKEIKMILLGESGVGKTSIIKRYVNDVFDKSENCTLSMTYVGKIVEIDGQKVKLNIWDTIGQEKYRSLSKLFLNETKIVILVYSINFEQSFIALDYWYNLYQEILEPGTILGIAGNKMDLYLEQEVSDEKVEEYAKSHNAIFSLLSAKDNKSSLDAYINKLVKAYLDKEKKDKGENIIENNTTIKLNQENLEANKESSKEKNGCCGGNGKGKTKKKESNSKDKIKYINTVFLGDNGVGKTSLIKRIEGKDFNKLQQHTDKISETTIDYKNNTKLKIYDLDNDKKASKEFINIVTNGNIYFLVYDVKNKESLDNLENFWIKSIKKYKEEDKNNEKYLLFILGNKKDKSNGDEEIKEFIEEGKKMANDIKGIFKTISALDNNGLENIIEDAMESYLGLL